MQKQYFSSLFEDKFNGGHFVVVSAATNPIDALTDAQRHLEHVGEVRPSTLGVFSGVLRQLVSGVPFGPESEMILTNSAKKLDFELAQPLMLDFWSSLEGQFYAASVHPPEELEDTCDPETLTVRFEDGMWSLWSSEAVGQENFTFFADAVAAGNIIIARIEAGFQLVTA